jgi:hypothetical protein
MSILAILFSLVIWGLIFWLLWWAVGALALPEPFAKVITVILIIGAVVVILGLLMGSIAPFGFLPFK